MLVRHWNSAVIGIIITVAEKPQFGNRYCVTVTKGSSCSSLSQDAARFLGTFWRAREFLHEWLQSCWGRNWGLVWVSLTKRSVTDNIYENNFSGLASFWSGVPSTRYQSAAVGNTARNEVESCSRKAWRCLPAAGQCVKGTQSHNHRAPNQLLRAYSRICYYYYCTLCQHPATGSPSGPCKIEFTDLNFCWQRFQCQTQKPNAQSSQQRWEV